MFLEPFFPSGEQCCFSLFCVGNWRTGKVAQNPQ